MGKKQISFFGVSIKNFFFGWKKFFEWEFLYLSALGRCSKWIQKLFRLKNCCFFGKYNNFVLWVEKKFWVEISLFECAKSLQFRLLLACTKKYIYVKKLKSNISHFTCQKTVNVGEKTLTKLN